MVERAPLSIRIGGSLYKVQATAAPDEIRRLAELVDAKLREVNPGNRPMTAQMFLLVAMSFAHEASQERALRESETARASAGAEAEVVRATSQVELELVKAKTRAELESVRAAMRAELDALRAELEREREGRKATEAGARDLLRRVLARIDLALEDDGDDGDDGDGDEHGDEHGDEGDIPGV